METRNVIIDGVEYVPKVTPEVPDYPLPLQEGDKFQEPSVVAIWTVDAIYDDWAICSRLYGRERACGRFCINAPAIRIISRKPLHERVRLGDRVRIHGDEYKVASIYGASEKVVLGSDARQFNFADFDANAELLPREECNAD